MGASLQMDGIGRENGVNGLLKAAIFSGAVYHALVLTAQSDARRYKCDLFDISCKSKGR